MRSHVRHSQALVAYVAGRGINSEVHRRKLLGGASPGRAPAERDVSSKPADSADGAAFAREGGTASDRAREAESDAAGARAQADELAGAAGRRSDAGAAGRCAATDLSNDQRNAGPSGREWHFDRSRDVPRKGRALSAAQARGISPG